MIGRLNHIAIAVPDLTAASAKYRDLLGAHVGQPQSLPEHGVTVIFIDTGNTKVELLEPLGDNSPIAAFLAKNPSGGMHHVCFEVADLAAGHRHARCRWRPGARRRPPQDRRAWKTGGVFYTPRTSTAR